MNVRLFATCLCLVSFAPLGAQPLGDEFRVNTTTVNDQGFARVFVTPAGAVVVWSGPEGAGVGDGIFGQRFSVSGTPLGPEFNVTAAPGSRTGNQRFARLAADSAGNLVVVWQSDGHEDAGGTPASLGLFGQRFAGSGAALGADFHVNTTTTGSQTVGAVGMDAAGKFVVVWSSPDGSAAGVFGQRYTASGAPLAGEFRINDVTSDDQYADGGVAFDASGNFLVVWVSAGQDGSDSGIVARRYASSGSPIGTDFVVNTTFVGTQGEPAIASTPTGFVIVWSGVSGIFGQRLTTLGAKVDGEFRVDSSTLGNQHEPAVAVDGAGNFVAVWSGNGSGLDVFARRYKASGEPLGADFRVNVQTALDQSAPSVASDVLGDVTVVWNSQGQDGSGLAVLGRRFGLAVPAVPGSDFQLNVHTASYQQFPRAAPLPNGGFVVAWNGAGADDLHGIHARRFTAGIAPATGQFRVNTYTSGTQRLPIAASDGSGNFVVVWNSETGEDGSLHGVFGQRFGATGAAAGAAFRVNQTTTLGQYAHAVAMDAVGDFLVAWMSADADLAGIFAQRFSAGGVRQGPEFQVATSPVGDQVSPWVAADPGGTFLVVWHQTGGTPGVFGRRFSSSGVGLGGQFRVNTTLTGDQRDASAAFDAAGNFVVFWTSAADVATPQLSELRAQRFGASGAPTGGEFRINTYTTFSQFFVAGAFDAAGRFLVVWTSSFQDGDGFGSFGQWFAPTGAPFGAEFRVNTYTSGGQWAPAVISTRPAEFLVLWHGDNQDGSVSGIYGKLICLRGDPTGDGNVNVSDILYLINHLFAGGPAPVGCSDANGDGLISVSDVLFLVNYLFAGGPPPV